MKSPSILRRPLRASGVLAALLLASQLPASDHADPMSLNVFTLQDDPEANITDLHAFITDADGHRLAADRAPTSADALVVSLCMRRALLPDAAGGLELGGYEFRLHLDLDPPLRFADPAKTRDGRDYAAELARLNAAVADAKTPEAKSAAAAVLGRVIAEHDSDSTAQALYGGIVTQPTGIAEEVTLNYELGLQKLPPAVEGGVAGYEARITGLQIYGVGGAVNLVSRVPKVNAFKPGVINVQAGIFDDPFIFPRFFRKNVVGVVASIPLANLRRPDGSLALDGPIALWATTHKGNRQIDHVGRSLRTQLPRFGYLNNKHPAQHVATIIQVHDRPTLMEDVLATFIAPLEAHRHYDNAPDVMIYDLRKPARFPNGRRYEDDISKPLADAGETLLFELSYAESRQFPRATINDKPFGNAFPYLAPPWTAAEIAATKLPGSTLPLAGGGVFQVPRAPDSDALAPPNFGPGVWTSLWQGLAIGLVLFAVLLVFTVKTWTTRIVVVGVTFLGFCLIHPMLDAPMAVMAQAGQKLAAAISGAVVLAMFVVGWIYSLGRRHGAKPPIDPRDLREGLIADDRQPVAVSYAEMKQALFTTPYSVAPWGSPGATPLPTYALTFSSLVRGIWKRSTHYFLHASQRTVLSHADLRWGPDRLGFHRLLHPNGIILAGEWTIDASPADASYTGYFAPGKSARVIGRYSTCCTETRGGNYRSLALVAKIYPPTDVDPANPVRPASLVTQEDIGGTYSDSIVDAVLTNSPPVTPLARGEGVFSLLLTALTLAKADDEISERQLYEIAELEKPAGVPTSCPRFLRLKVVSNVGRGPATGLDFREEILGWIYDRGDATPRRKLEFEIEVSDAGKRVGALNQRLVGQKWTRIGKLSFSEAAASYNGDFVVHFRHPPWRTNRNDPKTVARVGRS